MTADQVKAGVAEVVEQFRIQRQHIIPAVRALTGRELELIRCAIIAEQEARATADGLYRSRAPFRPTIENRA